MMRPRPSDPRVSTTILVFSSIPPKKGTLFPKSVEINMATATIKAKNLVNSHKILDTLFIASNIFPPLFCLKKERGTLEAPFQMIAKKRLIYTFQVEPLEQ